MNIKRHLGTAAAIAAGMLIAAGSASAAGKLDGYLDGPERGPALRSGQAAVAYFLANERSTLVQSAGPAAIQFFRANERATMSSPGPTAAVSYVDGWERGRPYSEASPELDVAVTGTSEFDWASAAIGASSVLIVALLLSATLIVFRHSRARPVAR